MGEKVDRTEIARKLRAIDTGSGGFVKAIAEAIGISWANMSGMQNKLYVTKCRLAKLIESAPAEPSASAQELADAIRETAPGALATDLAKRYDLGGRVDDLDDLLEVRDRLADEIERVAVERKEVAIVDASTEDLIRVLADARGTTYDEMVCRVTECMPDLSGFIELPKDKDGVPIRPGDTVRYKNDAPSMISMLRLIKKRGDNPSWDFFCENGACYGPGTFGELHHYRPRTIDDVLEDAIKIDVATPIELGFTVTHLVGEAYELGQKEAANGAH